MLLCRYPLGAAAPAELLEAGEVVMPVAKAARVPISQLPEWAAMQADSTLRRILCCLIVEQAVGQSCRDASDFGRKRTGTGWHTIRISTGRFPLCAPESLMHHLNCSECGHSLSTWTVRCPGCRGWNFAWFAPVGTLLLGATVVLWMSR